jgi:hypothetical protein
MQAAARACRGLEADRSEENSRCFDLMGTRSIPEELFESNIPVLPFSIAATWI